MSFHLHDTQKMLNFRILFLLLLIVSCSFDKSPGQTSSDVNSDAFIIVVADSNFCYSQKHLNVTIVNHDSSTDCENFDLNLFNKFHGHHIIKNFLFYFKPTKAVEIHLFSVFENDISNPESWKNVINFSNKNKVNLFMSAAGLKNNTLPLFFTDQTTVFLSAGQTGRLIKNTDKLYPQGLPHTKKLLFGHYFEGKSGNYLDNTLLPYDEAIVMIKSAEGNPLKGSSYSMAFGSAQILNKCLDSDKKFYQCARKILKPFVGANTKLQNLLSL
jgi:hypothetical protein